MLKRKIWNTSLATLLADTSIFHVVAISIPSTTKTLSELSYTLKSIRLVSKWGKLIDWKWAKALGTNLSINKSAARNMLKQKEELRYVQKVSRFQVFFMVLGVFEITINLKSYEWFEKMYSMDFSWF